MAVKLEVGKRYRNRTGEVVKIIRRETFTTHQYEGSDGENYRYNGRFGFFRDHVLDLIEETSDATHDRSGPWTNFFTGIVDGSYTNVA